MTSHPGRPSRRTMDRKLLTEALHACGARIDPGLSRSELAEVEATYDVSFAPDHRLMLSLGLPQGRGWPDWRQGDEPDLRRRLNRPADDLLFSVGRDFWTPAWGQRPATSEAAVSQVRALLDGAPRLGLVHGHRFLSGDPVPGNPVLSIHETDLVLLGHDLLDYLGYLQNPYLADDRWMRTPARHVPFWTDLLNVGTRG